MSVPTKPQVRAGNLWNTYVRAWAHGAAVKPLDPKFTGHTNAEIREAYTRGYKVGRDARNIAAQDAATIYGYEPSVLRLAEHSIRCGVEGCRLPPDHDGMHKFGREHPVSNKRNRRRAGQRVRAEVDRKPKKITKAMCAALAALPIERARKERERYWKKPTKAEAHERERRIRRWRLGSRGAAPPRKQRKPRTKYGKTFWEHSHDV